MQFETSGASRAGCKIHQQSHGRWCISLWTNFFSVAVPHSWHHDNHFINQSNIMNERDDRFVEINILAVCLEPNRAFIHHFEKHIGGNLESSTNQLSGAGIFASLAVGFRVELSSHLLFAFYVLESLYCTYWPSSCSDREMCLQTWPLPPELAPHPLLLHIEITKDCIRIQISSWQILHI